MSFFTNLSDLDLPVCDTVPRHLTKLFDSMARLKFREEGGTVAVGMWAKDGEYVEFDTAIDCVGPVGG